MGCPFSTVPNRSGLSTDTRSELARVVENSSVHEDAIESCPKMKHHWDTVLHMHDRNDGRWAQNL